MQRIGLYYPYVHFRDQQWIKAAALYWPHLARVVPPGFPVNDSGVVRALQDDLDFVVDVDPRPAADAIAATFLEVLEDHRAELQERFLATPSTRSVQGSYNYPDQHEPSSGSGIVSVSSEPSSLREHLAWPLQMRPLAGLHWDEVSPLLRDAFLDADIAVSTPFPIIEIGKTRWFATDPIVAWVYKCALTDELARRSRYTPTTDQVTAHGATGGWDAERIAAALLGRAEEPPPVDGDPAAQLGLMAVRCVLPEDLSAIPVDKIIQLRKRYETEFNAFTSGVEKAATELKQHVEGIEDHAAFERYLQMQFDQSLAKPLQDLRKAMTGLNIKTFHGAMNYKFSLPTAAAVLGGVAGRSVLDGAAGKTAATAIGASFALATMRRMAVDARDAQLSNSPVSYLLRIERDVRPATLVRRVAQGIGRAAGTGL